MAVPAISQILKAAHASGSKRVHGKHMALILLPKKHLLKRNVIIVGTKVSKLATERNRVKRRLRVAAQDSPIYLVIIAKPSAKTIKPSELRQDLFSGLQKLPK